MLQWDALLNLSGRSLQCYYFELAKLLLVQLETWKTSRMKGCIPCNCFHAGIEMKEDEERHRGDLRLHSEGMTESRAGPGQMRAVDDTFVNKWGFW